MLSERFGLLLKDARQQLKIAKAPNGVAAEMRDASAAALEGAARSALRRQTWTGRHVHLHEEGNDPAPARSKTKGVGAVSQVSRQAYLIASAGRERPRQSKRSVKSR